jgi:L-lactate dehydrogenase
MKVSIVGVGHVGSSLGLALVAGGHTDELVLVGRRKDVVAGEALDLLHASAFTRPVDVKAGEIADTAGSDVIAICVAGKSEGSIREGAVASNAQIFRNIIPPLAAASPSAVLLVTSNPLDTMTTLALRLSGLPPAQVIGSGTLLDTMRLRVLLSRQCQIHPHDIRAYVLGEHGDSQFAALSSASSGGARLPLKPALLKQMVVNGDFGVRDVCLSLPAVIGRRGVLQTLKVELTGDEKQAFRRSATVVKATLKKATTALEASAKRGAA